MIDMIFFILYCCKQMWGVERGSICMVGPGRQLASLRYCNYLVGSKCKSISCRKVYYSSRPKSFFLCVNRGTTDKIFKPCFWL